MDRSAWFLIVNQTVIINCIYRSCARRSMRFTSSYILQYRLPWCWHILYCQSCK